MEHEIIDNFLSDKDFLMVSSVILGDQFPWYFCDYVTDRDIKEPEGYRQYQFYCSLYGTNQGMGSTIAENILDKFKTKLNVSSWMRAKMNLSPQGANIERNEFHTDFPKITNYTTAIFYVNTNNGYTLFENGNKVESIANRIVIFTGNTPHTGTTCTDENRRVVLNLNYV